MALGYTMGNDPLTAAAPVLKLGGPNAYEAWSARAKMETTQDALKQKADADAADLKERQRDAVAKQYKLDLSTPYFTHQKAFKDDRQSYQTLLAMKDQAYRADKSGTLGNPFDETDTRPGGGGSVEVAFSRQNLIEKANRSGQMGKIYEDANKYVSEHPEAVRPGTKEKIDEWISNAKNLEEGNIIPPLAGNIDLIKAMAPLAKEIQASTEARGGIDDNGAAFTMTEETVTDPQIRAMTDGMLMDPHNLDQAKYDLEIVKQNDPARYAVIQAVAKKNNMPEENAMLYDIAVDQYAYKKEGRTQGGVSSAGAGALDMQAGLDWLATITKAVHEDRYQGPTTTSKGLNPFKGEVVELETPEDMKFLRGFKLGSRTATLGSGTDAKTLKSDVSVNNISYDRKNNEWVLETVEAVGTDEKGKVVPNQKRVLVFPAKVFESNVYPTLIGENPEKIKGIGGYTKSNLVKPGFEEKRAQNMTGSKMGGGGALDIENAGELD